MNARSTCGLLCKAAGTWGISLLVVSALAEAHTINQKVGGYEGTDGMSRRQVGVGMAIESGPAGKMSSSVVSINVKEDRIVQEPREDVDPSAEKRNSLDVTATQVWDKLTETSIVMSGSKEADLKNRTIGVGVKQWFHHETFRYSIDVSRTVIEQPHIEILDYDSQVLTPPPVGESIGVNLGLRHLASPKTVIDYTFGHIAQEGRPLSYSGGVAVRQFIEATNGAVHVDGTRAINRGKIGTQTTNGQLDSWTAELAYLQNLWKGALTRVGYRYYKELEITRAYEDRIQTGTDAISVGFTQTIDDRDFAPVPLTFEAAGARLLTNSDIAASTFEAGLTAKF